MQELYAKSRPELMQMAKSMGIKASISDKKIDLINKLSHTVDAIRPNHKPGEKPVFKKEESSREEIEAEAQKYAGKGFELRFPDDDTWQVKCRGATDSGTRYQSIKAIAFCFMKVARGAHVPRKLKSGTAELLVF